MSQPQPQPQKLRTSCDSCHFSKIKCIKSTNGCQRCISNGERCEYSPALPRMYQKRRSGKSGPNQSHAVLPPNNQLLPSQSSIDKISQPRFGESGLPELTTNHETAGAFDELSFNASAVESNALFWPHAPDGSLMENLFPESDSLPLDLWQTDSTSNGMSSAATPMSQSSFSGTSSSLAASAAGNSDHSSQPNVSGRESIATDPVYTRTIPTTTPCSCFPRLLDAMQRVSVYARLSAPALDTVLSVNRTVAKHCVASLKCEQGVCQAINTSCTTMACGLLDHTLASYESALENFCAGLEAAIGKDEQSVVEDDENHDHTRIAAGSLQVKLGIFTVERSDQMRWAREIVAREILKVLEAVKDCVWVEHDIRNDLLAYLSKRCSDLIDEFGN